MLTAKRILIAMILLPSPLWAGGDVEKGERLALQCVACHGSRGVAPNPTFPHLAGQNSSYLAIQLHDFRSGERFHPVMSPIAQALSDPHIDDLSVYFESLPLMRLEGGTQAAAAPWAEEE